MNRIRMAVLVLVAVAVAVLVPAAGAAASPTPVPVTSQPTTATTIAGIVGNVPTAPSTVPLRTHATSGTLDPMLGRYSEIGFAVFVLLLMIQFVLTRPGRRGRRTL